MLVGYVLFFFSSRRRHTISDGDWSSDVCSSDLRAGLPLLRRVTHLHGAGAVAERAEIGRASCRERVYISVVAVSVKKKRRRGGGNGQSVSGESSSDSKITI